MYPRCGFSLLSLFVALGLLLPAPAAAQAPVPTPGARPAPDQPLTPNSIPAVRGKRFPTGRAHQLVALMDANANVNNITAANLVDVQRNNTLDPLQVQTLFRLMNTRPRVALLAGQLTAALQQRGLLGGNQVVLAVVADRVYVATLPR